jgi:hypothetical protein
MSQRFWAIYGTHGFYTGTWITRAEAIKDHCEAKGWDWRTCYRRGDRCVRVEVREISKSRASRRGPHQEGI